MKIPAKQVPTEWTEIQKSIAERLGQHAILAGGALRDLHCDKPVKDIDIFVPSYSLDHWERLQDDLSGFFGIEPFETFSVDDDYRTWSWHVTGFASWGVLPLAQPVQVIGLDMDEGFNMTNVLGRIDFGICQIGMGLNGKIHVTDAFRRDYIDNSFTLQHAPNAAALLQSVRRYERLQEKFEGWNFQAHPDLLRNPDLTLAPTSVTDEVDEFPFF